MKTKAFLFNSYFKNRFKNRFKNLLLDFLFKRQLLSSLFKNPLIALVFLLPMLVFAQDVKTSQPLTVEQIRALTREQIQSLRPAEIKALRPEQIKSMSSRQLKSLKPSQVQAFRSNQIGSFTDDHIESFSASDVLKFNSNQIGQGLTPQQLQLFDRAKFQALGPEYIRKLRTDHISALSDDHINFLKPNQIQAFTPRQAQTLNREQVRSMSAKQLRSLNSGQIKQKFLPKDIPNLDLNNNIYGLDKKQISYLTPSQKQGLIKQQYNGLSLRQFQSLTPEQISSIDSEVLRGLSDNKLKSLTPKQIKALTPEQLNNFKKNQLALFENNSMIDEETAQSMDETEARSLCLDVGPGGCGGVTTIMGGEGLSNICEMLLQSPLCKDVPEDKKKDCSMSDSGIVKTPYNTIWGCLKYSVGEALKAMWDLMKWVWKNISNANAREETGDMAGRAMESVKLYLHSEYEKAYEEASFPKSAKATMAVGASLAKLLYDSIADTLSEDVAEWSCLNTQGKSGKVCSWLLALAPVGGGAIPLSKVLNKLVTGKWNKMQKRRRVLAEEALDRKLTKEQADAVERAHLVGAGEMGKDGINPAMIGNYTEAQLREKAKILRQAGFSKLEREKLIKKGIVGLGELYGTAYMLAGGAVFTMMPAIWMVFSASARLTNSIHRKIHMKKIAPILGKKLTDKQAKRLSHLLNSRGVYSRSNILYYIDDYRQTRNENTSKHFIRRKYGGMGEKEGYKAISEAYAHRYVRIYGWSSVDIIPEVHRFYKLKRKEYLEKEGFSKNEIERIEPYFDDVQDVVSFRKKGFSIEDMERLHMYESLDRSLVLELMDIGFSKDEIAKLIQAKMLKPLPVK